MHRLIADEDPHAPGELPARLAPTMASFRLLVLAFVRDYIRMTGSGPSYGEIAAKLGTNRMRVKRAVTSLVDDGLLIRTPGRRGLRLPSLREAAVRHLRELGWRVDEDALTLGPPDHWLDTQVPVPVTKRTLLTTPALDYPARRGAPSRDADGAVDGVTGGEGEGARSRPGAKRAA